MIANDDDPFDALLRKLNKLVLLDEVDRAAVRSLPFTIMAAAPGKYLVREGQRETSCCILLSGFACRHKSTLKGDRQIVSFHIPGDLLDVQTLLFAVADHAIQTITAARYLVVPSDELRAVAATRRAVADALWRDTFIDASVFREWVLNVGRRDMRARIAHMLCEVATRCALAGLAHAESFEFPMTPEDIADATGLNGVQVARTLAVLVDEGLIARAGPHLRVGEWGALCRAGSFDPAYLHAAA